MSLSISWPFVQGTSSEGRADEHNRHLAKGKVPTRSQNLKPGTYSYRRPNLGTGEAEILYEYRRSYPLMGAYGP
eukprot:scaffold410965_cov14-Prasinocladus_malaysianus.AAC.1